MTIAPAAVDTKSNLDRYLLSIQFPLHDIKLGFYEKSPDDMVPRKLHSDQAHYRWLGNLSRA